MLLCRTLDCQGAFSRDWATRALRHSRLPLPPLLACPRPQAAHAAHLNDPAPARAPPEVPVLSVEEAAAVMSHEAQLGHDTGKGSYAAKVSTDPRQGTQARTGTSMYGILPCSVSYLVSHMCAAACWSVGVQLKVPLPTSCHKLRAPSAPHTCTSICLYRIRSKQ